jgi:hypothetical protein
MGLFSVRRFFGMRKDGDWSAGGACEEVSLAEHATGATVLIRSSSLLEFRSLFLRNSQSL